LWKSQRAILFIGDVVALAAVRKVVYLPALIASGQLGGSMSVDTAANVVSLDAVSTII